MNNFILLALALAVFVGLGWLIVARLVASDAAGLRARLFDAFHGSATIVVARLAALVSSGLEAASGLADILGAPGVRDAIQGVVPAQIWPWLMLLFSVAAEIARRRTL